VVPDFFEGAPTDFFVADLGGPVAFGIREAIHSFCKSGEIKNATRAKDVG